MLEIGVEGGRSGCRTHDEAVALARALHASPAVALVGIECYEGLGAKGRSEADAPYANALMDRVEAIARLCDAQRPVRHRRGADVGRRLGHLRPRRRRA